MKKNIQKMGSLLAAILLAAAVGLSGCGSSAGSADSASSADITAADSTAADTTTVDSTTADTTADSTAADTTAADSATADSGTTGDSTMADSTTAGDSTASASGELSVTDMMNRQVKLAGPAKKIVVLTAGDCEILYAIGAGDLVVGRGEYCDYPDQAADIPSIQSGENTNVEQVVALDPDVVIMSTMDQTDEQVKSIEDAGIPVVETSAQDIEGVYTAITLLGEVSGQGEKADSLISRMKDGFQQIIDEAAKKDLGDKTVYFEVSPLEYGLWTAGSATFMDEIAKMLGVRNVFADISGWGEISEEQVIERNPDYIVTITMYTGQGEKPDEEIMSRAGWGDITAVKEKKVYNADSNEISRPGPRLNDAAKQLYSFFYE